MMFFYQKIVNYRNLANVQSYVSFFSDIRINDVILHYSECVFFNLLIIHLNARHVFKNPF